jgi:hypothetical protein
MPSWVRLVTDLIAGYAGVRDHGGGFAGALRATPRSVPCWTCGHRHAAPVTARRCAEAELERRTQGRGQVFTLLHCEPCAEGVGSSWWDDVPGLAACPRCGVPLQWLKLVVTESGPAVDRGNGKH